MSEGFLTLDPEMSRVLLLAENVAASRATVLICGESGTGKEVLAKFIHLKSPRSGKRLVAINCAAIPGELLESELFGYERGAFTGATQAKPGKFELAHDSTFLLDEISELPLPLQAKLLRVIQEGEVERLGGKNPLRINVRLIATSNRDLAKMVATGIFREDLFYRLNVIPLPIPPLRARPKDVEILARRFAESSSRQNGKMEKPLSVAAMDKLKSWRWPGNIRELENVIERSVLVATGKSIEVEDIVLQGSGFYSEEPPTLDSLRAGVTISEIEKRLILKTLEHTKQNRTQAAQMLGISIRTLRNKLHEYYDVSNDSGHDTENMAGEGIVSG